MPHRQGVVLARSHPDSQFTPTICQVVGVLDQRMNYITLTPGFPDSPRPHPLDFPLQIQ